MDFPMVDIGKVPDYWWAICELYSWVKSKNSRQIQGIKSATLYTRLNICHPLGRPDIKEWSSVAWRANWDQAKIVIRPTVIQPQLLVCGGATIEIVAIF